MGHLHERRPFDLVVAIAGRFGQPRGALADAGDVEAAGTRHASITVGETGELEDVGVSCGQSHDGRSVAADEERHVRLHRPNAELVERHVVELAVEAAAPSSSSARSTLIDSAKRRTRAAGSRSGAPIASCSEAM